MGNKPLNLSSAAFLCALAKRLSIRSANLALLPD
jgi:hypothetical protein